MSLLPRMYNNNRINAVLGQTNRLKLLQYLQCSPKRWNNYYCNNNNMLMMMIHTSNNNNKGNNNNSSDNQSQKKNQYNRKGNLTTNSTDTNNNHNITNNNLQNVQSMRRVLSKQQSDSNNNDITESWDELWKQKITPWDIGKQTPVLISELKQLLENQFQSLVIKTQKLGKSNNHNYSYCHTDKSLRTFIPGCGGGYDLVTMAQYQHNYIQMLLLHEKHNQTSIKKENNETKQSKEDAHFSTMISNSSVVGLDISPTSLHKAKEVVHSLLSQQQNVRSKDDNETIVNTHNTTSNTVIGTNIHLVQGDFFSSQSKWVYQSIIPFSNHDTKLEEDVDKYNITTIKTDDNPYNHHHNKSNYSIATDMDKFDLIFDYTFFCAIPPHLRCQWGERMSTLLKPNGGKLLTLIFPMVPVLIDNPCNGRSDNCIHDKASVTEGPPYQVTIEDYKNVLEPHGFQMMEGSPYEHEDTISARKGKEVVCWWELHHNPTSSKL